MESFILSISLKLYSKPSTTTSVEFSKSHSGEISTMESCEHIILDVKHLYAMVLIGDIGATCITFKMVSTILPPTE